MTEPAFRPNVGARIAVADAGPLIHLDELDCLNLLTDFIEVRVPEAVWREVERHRPQALLAHDIPWIKCSAPTSRKVDAVAALYTLHPGEREALSLCIDYPESLLLTDDTEATAPRVAKWSWMAASRGAPAWRCWNSTSRSTRRSSIVDPGFITNVRKKLAFDQR